MFVRGYAMYMEVDTGRQLREILQANPMWCDETYRVYVLEEEGPLTEIRYEAGKQRFLILARPAKPLPPNLDYEGTDRLLAKLRDDHGALVHRLVEDVAGYAILVSVDSNDQLREFLEPLPITPYVHYEISPLGSLEAHSKHIQKLGLPDPFRKRS
jgi:muconolactone delta-isomerase